MKRASINESQMKGRRSGFLSRQVSKGVILYFPGESFSLGTGPQLCQKQVPALEKCLQPPRPIRQAGSLVLPLPSQFLQIHRMKKCSALKLQLTSDSHLPLYIFSSAYVYHTKYPLWSGKSGNTRTIKRGLFMNNLL